MSVALVFDVNRLRKIRIRCGQSVQEVADGTGIQANVLQKIESGRTRQPRMATLRKLAGHFGVEVEDFFAEVEVDDPPADAARPLAVEGVA